MGADSSQNDARKKTHHFIFALHKHVLATDLGNSAVPSSREQINVREKCKAVETLLEESVGGPILL